MPDGDVSDSSGLNKVGRFLDILANAELLSAADLALIEQSWRPRANDDSQLLAKELVQQSKLTRYQAAAIYQGKTKGLVLGDYVVLDKLGAGGMGTVYKATQRSTGQTVAIKILSTIRSPDSAKRFQRESQMAARLNHPNIVRASEATVFNQQHFFVMEYVEGVDLSNYLRKHGPLPWQQAVQCVVQAARALEYAHSQGVIHRDIKPGNLFLTRDGVIKILDMGLARLNEAADVMNGEAHGGLTQTGQVMGTVDYMAPEQALHAKHADARADIYGLGCSLYRLIAGELPFQGESVVEKILAHREQPIPYLRAVKSDVPPSLDVVVQRMLAKRPDDRFQTMRELADALENVTSVPATSTPIALPVAVSYAPVSSAPWSPAPAVVESVSIATETQSSRRYAPLISAAAAIVVAVGAGIATFQWARQSPSPVAEQAAKVAPKIASPAKASPTSKSSSPPPVTDSAVPKPKPPIVASVNVAAPNPSATAQPPAPARSAPVTSAVAAKATSPSPVATASPTVQVVMDPAEAELHRQYAEGLFRIGGRAQCEWSRGSVLVDSVDKLPAAPFRVTSVSLSYTWPQPLRDADLRELTALSSLRNLNIDGRDNQLSPEGVSMLCKQLPNLEQLTGSGIQARFDVASFKALRDAANLRHLNTMLPSRNSLGDVIPHWTKLEKLVVSGPDIHGEAIAAIAASPSLKDVSIHFAQQLKDQDLVKLQSNNTIRDIKLVQVGITDEGLATLASMPALRTMELDYCKISGKGFAAARRSTMANLAVQASSIDNVGIAEIAKLESLSILGLSTMQGVTDEGLQSLKNAKSITSLHFRDMPLTGAAIAHWASLPKLRFLFFHKIPLNSTTLADLGNLPQLEYLTLGTCNTTDDALTKLRIPPRLIELVLSSCPLTDASVPTLSKFTTLKTLDLRGTELTAAGVARLRAALPNVRVLK